jgi:hypothetical protein
MWWRRGWRAAVQVFNIAVVLFVFAHLQGRMEPLIVSLFGLIYTAIRSAAIGHANTYGDFAVQLQNQLDQIKGLINPNFEFDWETRREALQEVRDAQSLLVFDIAGVSIVGLICLYYLFITIL